MCGTSAPTAKNRVATAMPIWPVEWSFAMIDQVIVRDALRLKCSRIEGALPLPVLHGGGTSEARPVRVGVRGCFHKHRLRGESPSPEIRCANFDLSPQAGRGEPCLRS